jgi:hypothetical protein
VDESENVVLDEFALVGADPGAERAEDFLREGDDGEEDCGEEGGLGLFRDDSIDEGAGEPHGSERKETLDQEEKGGREGPARGGVPGEMKGSGNVAEMAEGFREFGVEERR